MKPALSFAAASLAVLMGSSLQAQTLGTDFLADYSYIDLGTPGMVPGPLGGIHFKPGDNNTLWIGGNANNSLGAIYEVPVMRDANGHITGFAGNGVETIDAPNIDGGIAFAPNGVMLVTTYNNNRLLQYLPGSLVPDSDTDLTAAGVSSSVGTCQFVPTGFAGEGIFKVGSYNASQWYDMALTLNAQGTYDVGTVTPTVNTGGGPEGIVYIQGGNSGFTVDSVLISEYGANAVRAYEIDANGDPIPATQRDFMTSLSGAEGAVIDPVTGDFLFSTFGGGNRVIVVSGFDQPTQFCDGKVNSQGCVPTIDFVGSPTLSGPDDFVLTGTNFLNNSFGILIWSTTPGSISLGGGTLCLSGHFYRHPVQWSGGTAGGFGTDCSGTHTDALQQSWFMSNALTVGTTVYVQYVARDGGYNMPNDYSLSNGLRFTIRN